MPGNFVTCRSCDSRFHKHCAQWHASLNNGLKGHNDLSDPELFTCRHCTCKEFPYISRNKSSISKREIQDGVGFSLLGIAESLKSANPLDFALPVGFEQLSLRPSFIPITGKMKNELLNKTKTGNGEATRKGKKQRPAEKMKNRNTRIEADAGPGSEEKQRAADMSEEEAVFKPSCCRIIPFNEIKKNHSYLSHGKTASSSSEELRQTFYRQNARARVNDSRNVEEKTTLSDRAARANQRRMLKSLATLGDVSKKVDRLAGRDREQQLRFGKSQIHGWGVFAEEPINAGDMIIEYRGELIGNAVADKRELEYEKAKIGSDYMFRIDEYTVCDATKLGNVARFINASCSPNCFTQIITANENKRIVIYAKKNIQRGEELCYDYKFPIEYDREKRIPCHCGSSDCRGFMNWVSFQLNIFVVIIFLVTRHF